MTSTVDAKDCKQGLQSEPNFNNQQNDNIWRTSSAQTFPEVKEGTA